MSRTLFDFFFKNNSNKMRDEWKSKLLTRGAKPRTVARAGSGCDRNTSNNAEHVGFIYGTDTKIRLLGTVLGRGSFGCVKRILFSLKWSIVGRLCWGSVNWTSVSSL
jgi:hypothetical protein